MNSNLRIKKIHEIVKTQNENLLGQYTSLKDLNDRGFQIHLLDQRNHGRSFHEDTFD